jgi:hypothetical protein
MLSGPCPDELGVLDITAGGGLTYVQNTSGRVVHASFHNPNMTIGIDLQPGEKEAHRR